MWPSHSLTEREREKMDRETRLAEALIIVVIPLAHTNRERERETERDRDSQTSRSPSYCGHLSRSHTDAQTERLAEALIIAAIPASMVALSSQ